MQIIIQARMSSTRLPNKVLCRINGKPLIEYLVIRLDENFHGKIYFAISDHLDDDKIEKFCIEKDLPCFRGQLEDVSKRILDAVKHYDKEAFVRINGDSPLIDPVIIDKAIQIYQNGEYDLVTNTFPRSFPVGQSVEVIRTSTFEKAYKNMSIPDHFEHVTKYYYDNPDEFSVKNFSNERDLSGYRLVVDTPEDLIRMKKIIDSMTNPLTKYSLDELIKLYPST